MMREDLADRGGPKAAFSHRHSVVSEDPETEVEDRLQALKMFVGVVPTSGVRLVHQTFLERRMDPRSTDSFGCSGSAIPHSANDVSAEAMETVVLCYYQDWKRASQEIDFE